MITRVETETGSTYIFCPIYDGTGRLEFVRLNKDHELRKDQELIKCESDFELEVGKPMILKCEYLGPPTEEDMITLRITSRVTRIEYL